MPSILRAISAASRRVLRDLHAAAFAASAGMDLRLHHHAAADILGRHLGFVRRERHLAARHRNVVLAQDSLGLILVNFHGNLMITWT